MTMRDVLSEEVSLRTKMASSPPGHRQVCGSGATRVCAGGYSLGIIRSDSGVSWVELMKHDNPNLVRGTFEFADEAIQEFARLKALLLEREAVTTVLETVGYGGMDQAIILPIQFEPSIRSGDFEALLIAADFREDEGRSDDALLLRAMYHRTQHKADVVKASKKEFIHYNTAAAVWRRELIVVVVVPGERIRIISVKRLPGPTETPRIEREFKIGDRAIYGRYNLVYTGLIESITEKSVMVERSGTGEGRRRFTVREFANVNSDLDLEQIEKRNSEMMNTI